MIVVDADVTAYAFLRHDEERAALADAVDRIDPDWRVPAVWQAEFNNILVSYIRFRGMPIDDASRVLVRAMRQLQHEPILVTPLDVVAHAARGNCSAYDAEYVAAARAMGTKLVTGDRTLAAAFPEVVVTMEEFVGG